MTTLTKRELVRLHELTVSQIAALIRYLDVLPLDAGLTDAEIQKRNHQRTLARESLDSLKPISAKLAGLIRTTHDGEPFVGIAQQDPELFDWLTAASAADGRPGSFVRSLADAAFRADLENYTLMRPLLLVMKFKYPQYSRPEEKE